MSQVLIQAGHEGGRRNDGSGTAPTTGAGGIARPEREMTPIVADRATEVLRDHGITVERVDALFERSYSVDLAIFVHFDGSSRPCASGASIGYPLGIPAGSNQPTADLWRSIYEDYWPYQWMPDNFTPNLRGYYGYRYTSTRVAEVLLELGEISCPEQDAWIQPRTEWLGDVVAYFASEAIGAHAVPQPDPWGEDPTRLQRRWDRLERAEAVAARQRAWIAKHLGLTTTES